jgi:hypothetical protein
MKYVISLAGVVLYAFSCGAGAVADPASVSIQDLRPECKERHPAVPAEQCVIEDRLPSRQYATRLGGTVVVIQNVPVAPMTGGTESRPAPAENVNPRAGR